MAGVRRCDQATNYAMIYISVDNDHHGDLALILIKKLGLTEADIVFISHVSRRNNIIPASGYRRIILEGHPLSNGSGYKRLTSYIHSFKSQCKLNATFNFSPHDTLLIITEYQLNNALLARKMNKAGGKVYLFDEGIGFYFNNSSFHKIHITFADRFFLALYNFAFFILGIPAYTRKGFEGRMYVCIKDRFIDRIYSRMRLPINRPGPVHGYKNFLVSEKAQEEKNADTAIFFANNLSCFGLKDEELVLSENIIKQMAAVFKEVLIKVHPADVIDQNDIFLFYQKLATTHLNTRLLDNSLTGNEVLKEFKPRIVVGTMGASMFDAFFFGCQPIFVFQLLPEVAEFGVCRFTLENMGYHYIKSVSEIVPEYQSSVDIASLLYEEILFDEGFGFNIKDHALIFQQQVSG